MRVLNPLCVFMYFWTILFNLIVQITLQSAVPSGVCDVRNRWFFWPIVLVLSDFLPHSGSPQLPCSLSVFSDSNSCKQSNWTNKTIHMPCIQFYLLIFRLILVLLVNLSTHSWTRESISGFDASTPEDPLAFSATLWPSGLFALINCIIERCSFSRFSLMGAVWQGDCSHVYGPFGLLIGLPLLQRKPFGRRHNQLPNFVYLSLALLSDRVAPVVARLWYSPLIQFPIVLAHWR